MIDPNLRVRFRAARALLARDRELYGPVVEMLEAVADGEGCEMLNERFLLAGERMERDPVRYRKLVEFLEALAHGEGDDHPFVVVVRDDVARALDLPTPDTQ